MAVRKYRSREQWQVLIERQAQSGLGVTEFCRRFELTPKYFYRKRRQLRDAKALVPSGSPFVQVTPPPLAESGGSDQLELRYRDSRLRLPPTVSPTWLAQLLQSL